MWHSGSQAVVEVMGGGPRAATCFSSTPLPLASSVPPVNSSRARAPYITAPASCCKSTARVTASPCHTRFPTYRAKGERHQACLQRISIRCPYSSCQCLERSNRDSTGSSPWVRGFCVSAGPIVTGQNRVTRRNASWHTAALGSSLHQ